MGNPKQLSAFTILLSSLVAFSCCCWGAQGQMVAPATPTKFLLIHGATQGALVWYKIIGNLRFLRNVDIKAVDLTAQGLNPTATCDVTTVEKWAAPAEDYMKSLGASEKVIIVVHSAGGIVGQYLSNKYPHNIRAVVYIAAIMVPPSPPAPAPGPTPVTYLISPDSDLAAPGVVASTACDISFASLTSIKPIFCADCSPWDVTLLELLSKPFPIIPFTQPLVLGPDYLSVKRVWFKTLHDKAVTPSHQADLFTNQLPDKTILLNSGHQPMLSHPRQLTAALLSVAASYP